MLIQSVLPTGILPSRRWLNHVPRSIGWHITVSATVILNPNAAVFAQREKLHMRATVVVSRLTYRLNLRWLRPQDAARWHLSGRTSRCTRSRTCGFVFNSHIFPFRPGDRCRSSHSTRKTPSLAFRCINRLPCFVSRG
jgi:hypothetical protein